jgi:hypothetical protein
MLEQLPDELVLEIFSYLRPMRKKTLEDFKSTSVVKAHQSLIIGTREDISNVFGRGLIDLRNGVLVCDLVDTDRIRTRLTLSLPADATMAALSYLLL